MKTRFIIYSVLILCCFLFACNPNVSFHETKSVQSDWESSQKINFEFEITDSIASYSFYMLVRNNEDYAYSNIYFFINTYLPNLTFSRDTIECTLADKAGKWLGSGMGGIKESEHLIHKEIKFPRNGIYKMEVEQAMRVNPLRGIEDIGIKIVKNTDN